jgi:SAM-dependent methyltransferase
MYLVDLEPENGRYIYPEEAFRSWEEKRTAYEDEFGGMLAEQVSTVVGDAISPALLDVACGEGYGKQLIETRLPAVTVFGIDYDSEALSADRWLPIDEDAPRVSGDLAAMPFKHDSFDVVMSISGLTSIDPEFELPQVQKEIKRVLKPGGKLIITNDTPRGCDRVLSAPLDEIHHEDSELPVVAFDMHDELSEVIVADKTVLTTTIARLCQKVGLPALSMDDYYAAIENKSLEMFVGPIVAEAARLALASGDAYRPFEWFDNSGSWNQRFFNNVTDMFNPDFKFKSYTDVRNSEISPIEIINPAGSTLYVRRMQRDSIGNIYFRDLTTQKPEHTALDVTARFVVGTRRAL